MITDEQQFDADVRRLVQLQDTIKHLSDEADAIKARIREHGSGQVGELRVTVAPARRFSPQLAVEKLDADQLKEITETVISSTKAKAVLPPMVYESLMYAYGEPRVSVK